MPHDVTLQVCTFFTTVVTMRAVVWLIVTVGLHVALQSIFPEKDTNHMKMGLSACDTGKPPQLVALLPGLDFLFLNVQSRLHPTEGTQNLR
jgi:hypothetical protein